MSAPDEWAKGYARQAAADFATWESLQENKAIPECHKLLLLQMACEKLAKAHLCRFGTDPANLQASHAFIAKNLPVILARQMARSGLSRQVVRRASPHLKHLAQKIELLAPSVKRGSRRPDNCEYPWQDSGGRLHVPLDWKFFPSRLIVAPNGRMFVKLVRQAITQFLL